MPQSALSMHAWLLLYSSHYLIKLFLVILPLPRIDTSLPTTDWEKCFSTKNMGQTTCRWVRRLCRHNRWQEFAVRTWCWKTVQVYRSAQTSSPPGLVMLCRPISKRRRKSCLNSEQIVRGKMYQFDETKVVTKRSPQFCYPMYFTLHKLDYSPVITYKTWPPSFPFKSIVGTFIMGSWLLEMNPWNEGV